MQITEVRIKLMPVSNDKLRAFCSITIDNEFVVRDLKVIEGAKGPFVAMPSRKLSERCPRCSGKNHYRAAFCNDCGYRLAPQKQDSNPSGRLKLHADIAHPINARCRDVVQRRILEEYVLEVDRAKSPDYQPPEFDVFDVESLIDEGGEIVAEGFPRDEAKGMPEGARFFARQDGGGRADGPRREDLGGAPAPLEVSSSSGFTSLPPMRPEAAGGRGPWMEGGRGQGQGGRHPGARTDRRPAGRDDGGSGGRRRPRGGGDHGRRDDRRREAPRHEARGGPRSGESRPPFPRGRFEEPELERNPLARLHGEGAADLREATPPPRSAGFPPRESPVEVDAEPEDNFGAGLFS